MLRVHCTFPEPSKIKCSTSSCLHLITGNQTKARLRGTDPASYIFQVEAGTAAGNALAKAADVIIGQQLRFIAKGTAAVATPAMALEVLGNDDFQTSIKELNADLKELEME